MSEPAQNVKLQDVCALLGVPSDHPCRAAVQGLAEHWPTASRWWLAEEARRQLCLAPAPR